MLYFPALEPEDPNDLVLLCTVASAKPGQKLLVAYNDGRMAPLSPRDLTAALEWTYAYLAHTLPAARRATTRPTSSPAPAHRAVPSALTGEGRVRVTTDRAVILAPPTQPGQLESPAATAPADEAPTNASTAPAEAQP